MELGHIRDELANLPLDENVRAVVLSIVKWLEHVGVDAAQFITVNRVIKQIDAGTDIELISPALFVLSQVGGPLLSRGAYWIEDTGEIRVLESDLYVEALLSGSLVHPDHGTLHDDFMEWVEPFFWMNRQAVPETASERRA